MNIAIASEDGKKVSTPVESCHNFLVYEIVAGEVHYKHSLKLSDAETLGDFDLVNRDHPLEGVLVLISRGMERPLEQKLLEIGITSFVTEESNPDAAVRHYLDGELKVEPAGTHGKHHFEMMKKREGFVPVAGARPMGDIV